MARRKGANKSKAVGTRKTSVENTQTSKKNEKFKDDPGGTSSHKMDDTKQLVVSTKKIQNNHLNSSNTKNNLRQNLKIVSTSTNVNKSDTHRQQDNGKRLSQRNNNKQQHQNDIDMTTTIGNNLKLLNSSKDELSNNATNSDNSNNFINTSNNNVNNNNNSNNSNSKIDENDSSISTWNNLKYLHKKFKRIASATSSVDAASDLRIEADQIMTAAISPPVNSLSPSSLSLSNSHRNSLDSVESGGSGSIKGADVLMANNLNKNQFDVDNELLNVKNPSIVMNGHVSPTTAMQLSTSTPMSTPTPASITKPINTTSTQLKSNNLDKDTRTKFNNSESANQHNKHLPKLPLSSKDDGNKTIAAVQNNFSVTNSMNSPNSVNNFKNNSQNIPTYNEVTLVTSVNNFNNNSNSNNSNNSNNGNNNNSIATSLNRIVQHVANTVQQQQLPSNSTMHQHQIQTKQLANIREAVTVTAASTVAVAVPVTVADQVTFSGRHVCPFCNLNCTKPSVLQKHIRAHTNERPYPCEACGFAFKTRSNYYKHCRSRSHLSRTKGGEVPPDVDEVSLGSEHDLDLSNSSSDVISRTASPMDERTSSPAVQQQTNINFIHPLQPPSSPASVAAQQKPNNDRPYKPKFHNAGLYSSQKEESLINSNNLNAVGNHLQRQSQAGIQLQQSSISPANHSVNNTNQISQNYHINSQKLATPPPTQLQQHQQHQIHHQHQQQQQQLSQSGYYQISSQKQQLYPSQHQLSRDTVSPSISLHHHHNHHQQQHHHSAGVVVMPPTFVGYKNQHRNLQIVTNGATVGSMNYDAQSPQKVQQVLSSSPVAMGGNENHYHRKESTSSTASSSSSGASMISGLSPSLSAAAAAVGSGGQLNAEFLQEHISKIISQNEAIVENKELLLQKKYPKTLNRSKSINNTNSNSSNTVHQPSLSESASTKLAQTIVLKQQQLQQHQLLLQRSEEQAKQIQIGTLNGSSPVIASVKSPQKVPVNLRSSISPPQVDTSSLQPLNLSKPGESDNSRQRSSSVETPPSQGEPSSSNSTRTPATHPQNPERSIIKHLLLNARGLGVPNGEGEDAVYICPLCQQEFRTAQDLKLHTSSYCQGGPSSAPISPDGSPSYKFFRSNSINVSLPEFAKSSLLLLKNPLPLAKLAWSQLKTKPSNQVLNQLNIVTNANAAAAAAASSALASGPSSQLDSCQKYIDVPLPSPGPLLGKTPLVESYNHNEKKSEDVIITKVHEDRSFTKDYGKRLKYDSLYHPTTLAESESILTNSRSNSVTYTQNSNSSQSNYQFHMAGGEVQMGDQKGANKNSQYLLSGGSMIPLSECPDVDMSSKMVRTSLFSGGSFQEVPGKIKERSTSLSVPKMIIPVAPMTPSHPTPPMLSAGLPLPQHFQFPPINSITGFNPLTLPPRHIGISPSPIIHCEKVIPYVPGIPGPNTLAPLLPPPQQLLSPSNRVNYHQRFSTTSDTDRPLIPKINLPKQEMRNEGSPRDTNITRNVSPSRQKVPSPINMSFSNSAFENFQDVKESHSASTLQVPFKFSSLKSRSASNSSTPNVRNTKTSLKMDTLELPKKSFNFTRIADNLSPKKSASVEKLSKSPENEIRHFNFDNLQKPEIIVTPQPEMSPLHVDVQTSSTSKDQMETTDNSEEATPKPKRSKFLRPTSLPLKPGTFTPKRHHGITPTANTLPLISPETPRPSKACGQLYLNGHAYTILILKSSTKMFYCTVNCPQPSYVANVQKLSMYSKWQVCAENNKHPLGLGPKTVMALYDSRQKNNTYSMTSLKMTYVTTQSQPSVMTPFENNGGQFYHHQIKSLPMPSRSGSGSTRNTDSNSQKSSSSGGPQMLVGGYESNEDYTYIRGRGRGRYVCSECGIRCKKPSMLKKHIRTHTDVRPYTCQHCNFSFKTKGNLTKHMQSKTHYKKCLELGINPGPMPADYEFNDNDFDFDQRSINSGGGGTSSIPGESESDDFSDNDDREDESSDTDESKSRLPEHEAARCLLSLSMTPAGGNNVSPQHKGAYAYHQPLSKAIDAVSQPTTTSAKRVVSFTSPKPPFDYQKQEQYYPNPEESKPKSIRNTSTDESSAKPIDLTKPRTIEVPATTSSSLLLPPVTNSHQINSQAKDVIDVFSSESGLLKSLVSITDKIRSNTEAAAAKPDEQNTLLKAYLTEQALKYTKIRQSQMSKNFSDAIATSSSTMTMAGCSNRNQNSHNLISLYSPMTFVFSSSPVSNTNTTATNTMPAVSVAPQLSVIEKEKLFTEETKETKLIESNKEPEAIVQTAPVIPSTSIFPIVVTSTAHCSDTIKDAALKIPKAPGGAKSVASEYLKITTQKSSERSSKPEESEDSMSDQEMPLVETRPTIVPIAPIAPIVKPPTDFTGVLARTVIVGEDGFKNSANEVPVFPRVPISEDGRPKCHICSKTFQKQHQMVLHMNIHYMEQKFKCEACAISFRTQGHLQKHERSEAHKKKVMMTSTFGVPTTSNPRPFECTDCKIAFRIHGHLAKHLRSKTHVQKLECLQKLPFGTYAEIERAGISLTEIDTTDCDNSLISLKVLAQKLIEKDPNKLSSYTTPSGMDGTSPHNAPGSGGSNSHESGSDDGNDGQLDGVSTAEVGRENCDDYPIGLKRKLSSSFNNLSNDLSDNQSENATLEKRQKTSITTTSDISN